MTDKIWAIRMLISNFWPAVTCWCMVHPLGTQAQAVLCSASHIQTWGMDDTDRAASGLWSKHIWKFIYCLPSCISLPWVALLVESLQCLICPFFGLVTEANTSQVWLQVNSFSLIPFLQICPSRWGWLGQKLVLSVLRGVSSRIVPWHPDTPCSGNTSGTGFWTLPPVWFKALSQVAWARSAGASVCVGNQSSVLEIKVLCWKSKFSLLGGYFLLMLIIPASQTSSLTSWPPPFHFQGVGPCCLLRKSSRSVRVLMPMDHK